jgi:hypothetical protein
MKFEVNGTTLSGHPWTTTCGNTLRDTLYALYILHKAEITKKFFSAAGDDNKLIIERESYRDFSHAFW